MFRLLIVFFILATLSLPQMSFAKSKIAAARDYAQIEKNSEARQLLDQAILDDPLDADVHYGAGLVYGQLGMTSDFDLAMKNACKLKSSYCPKVAEPYYSMGLKNLSRGNQRSAIRSLEKAFTYQPAKRAEAINRLLTSGQGQLSHKNRGGAERYFSVLTHFDSSYKSQVAKLYFDMGQKATSGEAIEYYRLTSRYSDAYKKQIGDDLASMSKDNKYSDNEQNALLIEARKYLSDAEMLAHFPHKETLEYIREFINRQWLETESKIKSSDLNTEVILVYNGSGYLLYYKFKKRSENKKFDNSLARAISKSKKLGKPIFGKTEFIINFNLEEMLN